MTDPVYFPSSDFDAWAAAIRQRESTDNWASISSPGYMGVGYLGAYQMGKLALEDAGLERWSGKFGRFDKWKIRPTPARMTQIGTAHDEAGTDLASVG